MALCYINVDKCRINRGNETTERIYVIAIGQAQQWGYYKATSGSYTVTFPIAFSRQTCAVCVTNVNSGAGYPVTYTPNTSSIKITNKCYENFWIAVGFQQWGLASTKTGRDPVPFPIAFPKAIFSIAACSNYTTFYIDDVKIPTLTGFYTGIGSDQGDGLVWWFAIGKQQWGRSTAATLKFPISFQKFFCITTAQESWGGAAFENTSWIVRTNSSMTWPMYRGTNINYIAVGIQAKPKLCQKRTS